MSDITQPESQASVEMLEATKMRVKNVMASKYGLVTEDVVLPATLKKEPKAEEHPDDVMFRDEVSQVLPTVLEQEGNLLIIQNIATQHAVATTPVFLEAGLDIYFTFIPENKSIRPSSTQGSYYHPDRVISAALTNEARIRQAKEKLEREKLRGVVISIDSHADFEDENGEFDKFLPSEERLKDLGINRIVCMGEFAPQNAQGLTERRINKKEDWDKSHIYEYMRQMKSKGYPVTLIGIDTR